MKNDVNVPPTSNKEKKVRKKVFFVCVLKVMDAKAEAGAGAGFGSGFVIRRYGSPDPDQYQNVTGPEN